MKQDVAESLPLMHSFLELLEKEREKALIASLGRSLHSGGLRWFIQRASGVLGGAFST